MRLTCRFMPSWSTISSQAVGTDRRTLIGTGRSGNAGSGVQASYRGRSRAGAAQDDAMAQAVECCVIRDALYLDPIDFRQFVFGIRNAMSQGPVRGEDHEAFAITVQTAGRVHIRRRNVIGESRPSLRIGKTGQNIVGLMKENGLGPGERHKHHKGKARGESQASSTAVM